MKYKRSIQFWTHAVLLPLAYAQFSYQVLFPIVRDTRDQPHVDCASKDYTKTPPEVYLPKTGTDQQTGNFLGTCRACTAENYCVNQFTIKTVAYDAFSGSISDVTTCQPVDVNGNTVNLNNNVYSIVLRTKAPSFSAPSGNQIAGLGDTLKVIYSRNSQPFRLVDITVVVCACVCSATEGHG